MGSETGYVVVNWGKDQMDYLTKSKKSNELIGEEAGELWARTLAVTRKIYHKNGWMRSDLSYAHKPLAAK